IVSALHKLATAFPDPLADHISKTAEALRSHPVNTEFVSVLETISRCWTQQRKVRIWYYSPRSGTERTRVISPYTIEPSSGGGLYVIGHDDWSNSVRTFKIERVEKAEALQETYTIPPTFDPVTHFAHAWGIMGGDESPVTVRLRFSSGVAPYIRERIWHPSQTLTEQPDGALELVVRIAKLDEMRPWIRSWGADVTVVEPETLCHDIAEEAQRLVMLYHQR
ncbi:MAG: WYL domain-containing protein, partial [Anaerolineae bacterium]|nr:WYL domain-containing protein [Anaerolineae bacterium]